MTQLPKKAEFATSREPVLKMPQILKKAREWCAEINGSQIDSVTSCRRSDSGQWKAIIDVVESAARMGDNDLLSAYELTLDDYGELIDFQRTERFYREDRMS